MLMAAALRRSGITYSSQHRVRRAPPNGRRSYYLDFAIVSAMLAIECDGKAYHDTQRQLARDARRQAAIELQGWTFLRFTGSAIVKDANACVQVILTALKGFQDVPSD